MMKRLFGVLLATTLWLLAPHTVAAAFQATLVTQNPVIFDTVADMRQARGLSGTVSTRGYTSGGDGASMTYQISATRPDGPAGTMAVTLADGRWATPTSLPTQPPRQADAASASDSIARAKTFAAAGHDLIWDPDRATPLSGTVIHQRFSKPYALTCSSFVGMVLQGWDYSHTTYVANSNTVVGDYVDFGSATDLWQAHKLAHWFAANGDMWVNTDRSQLRPGDVLFFATPKDETLNGNYFANVYHTGIYLGDSRIIHSYGVASGAGVVEEDINETAWSDIALVARPHWSDGTPAAPVLSPTPTPSPMPSQEPEPPTDSPTPPSSSAPAPSGIATPPAAATSSSEVTPSPDSNPTATPSAEVSPETIPQETGTLTPSPSESPTLRSVPPSIDPVFATTEDPEVGRHRLFTALGASGLMLGGCLLTTGLAWLRRHGLKG